MQCKQTAMTPEQSFFAVFCIEALGDRKRAGEVEGAADVLDCTTDGKRDRLVWGGSGIHP